ncbi:hypothetical protein [Brevundimonas subvibrioides]|uniref:hypothetical protein n=1 Tax=Brevundimonas subvibrioides TaxID=74313 RepID=UPI0022B52592|nr:hypothetical protein [Brevundimonas subvibrioides]
MKVFRFALMLAVIGYAGWLAWPFLSPFLEGAPIAVAIERAGAMVEGGGGIPQAALWIGAVLLYVVAALLLGSGNPRAALAYFLGFVADAVLRLAIDRSGRSQNASLPADSYSAGSEMAQRSAEAVAPTGLPVDPTWLILGTLLVVGVMIVVLSRRRVRRRGPGQLAA